MKNVWHIVGCGPSGGNYLLLHEMDDMIIAVNDAAKFGYPLIGQFDYLMLVDPPHNFRYEPDRMEVIKGTISLSVLSRGLQWRSIFPKCQQVQSQMFTGKYLPSKLYHSNTSTFMAASFAINAGAEHVVFHGVDLIDHPKIKCRLLEHELRQYRLLQSHCEKSGMNMWVSSDKSRLAKFLPIWV